MLFQKACSVSDSSSDHFDKVCCICIHMLTLSITTILLVVCVLMLIDKWLEGEGILFSCVCVLFEQMMCELVRGEQKVEELEQELLSLLCSSQHDDYRRLTQKVSSTVEARKEVRRDPAMVS